MALPPDPVAPKLVKLTKTDIEEMIEHLKGMEGMEIDPKRPIDLSKDAAAWYIAYGTAKAIGDLGE